jgi:DNA adenine methylase
MKALCSPLKWHGGKSYLADWILSLAAPHTHWVEVYGGSLAVTLAKAPENVSEVVNDKYRHLQNFWMVLQNPELFESFRRRVEATPFSSVEWESASDLNQQELGTVESPAEQVERAVAFFIACRQSRTGSFKEFATLSRRRTRRKMNEQASAWLTAVEGLAEVHARLKRIVILNDDALSVIKSQDGPDTLFYLDPPYLPESRVAQDAYVHEMSRDDHAQLLAALSEIEGRFLLSGYPSDLYLQAEERFGWRRHEQEIANHVAGGDTKRKMTECIWTNYEIDQ